MWIMYYIVWFERPRLIKETGHADDSQTALSVLKEKETTNRKGQEKDENKDALVQACLLCKYPSLFIFLLRPPSLPVNNFLT